MRIRKPTITRYFQIFRKKKDSELGEEPVEELWTTVLYYHQVLDRMIEDYRLTNGAYEYSYKEVNVNG